MSQRGSLGPTDYRLTKNTFSQSLHSLTASANKTTKRGNAPKNKKRAMPHQECWVMQNAANRTMPSSANLIGFKQ